MLNVSKVDDIKVRAVRGKKGRNSAFVERFCEVATPERQHQQGGVVRECEPIHANSRVMMVRHRALCECKLDAYLHTRKIDKGEFDAGMRFRMAWLYKAEGVKTLDSTIERTGSGDASGVYERMGMAERVLKQAYAELTPIQALVVIKVCGSDDAAGGGERVVTLKRALDRLARLWSIK